MKKIILIVLVVITIVLLTGCGDAQTPQNQNVSVEDRLTAHEWTNGNTTVAFYKDGTYSSKSIGISMFRSSGTWTITNNPPEIWIQLDGYYNRKFAKYTNDEIESGRAIYPRDQWSVTDKYFEFEGNVFHAND
ncbi:MAG: hypothetical protein IJ639_12305 [Ruminococcus sp.]|nr:hypothetical protein [Ruminococcus sp.]